jgi:hypothetical protein
MGGGKSKNLYRTVYRMDHDTAGQPLLFPLHESASASGVYTGDPMWLDAPMIFMLMKSFIQHEPAYRLIASSLTYTDFCTYYDEKSAKRCYGYSIVLNYLSGLNVPYIRECIRSITTTRWTAFVKEHI